MKQNQTAAYKRALVNKRTFNPYCQLQKAPPVEGQEPSVIIRLYGHAKELRAWTVIKESDIQKVLNTTVREEPVETETPEAVA